MDGIFTGTAYANRSGLDNSIRRGPSIRYGECLETALRAGQPFRLSSLKLLAIGVGLVAGILEEIAFRSMLMDAARDRSVNSLLQILLSGVAFGLLHGMWALSRGSWRVGAGNVLTTGALGAALAVVYLVSGVVSHPAWRPTACLPRWWNQVWYWPL